MQRVAQLKFQFPNGSIKRITNGRYKGTCILFQFPNGSIKSSVRFYGCLYWNGFQFPNGSIKRYVEKATNPEKISFNSLMVRLKEVQKREKKLPIRCFNSLMVRLKDAVEVKGADSNEVSIP